MIGCKSGEPVFCLWICSAVQRARSWKGRKEEEHAGVRVSSPPAELLTQIGEKTHQWRSVDVRDWRVLERSADSLGLGRTTKQQSATGRRLV